MIFRAINCWNIIKVGDNIIPRSNCIRKETFNVSRRATFYFMKGIVIVLTAQRSAVSREFVLVIRRHVVLQYG